MKAIFQPSQFKRDFKRIKERGQDLGKLMGVVKSGRAIINQTLPFHLPRITLFCKEGGSCQI